MDFSLSPGGLSSGDDLYDVAIIGGGPAGATAAIYCARADLKTVVLDKAITAGALALTSKIANYPGVPGDVSGAELITRMRDQAVGFGAEFVQTQVMVAYLNGDPKEIVTAAGTYRARSAIIATGKMGRKQRVTGEEEFLGRGVSYCATCDAAFFRGRPVAVIGAGEHAVEEALFLARFASSVSIFVPGDTARASDEAMASVEDAPNITVHPRRPLRAITGDDAVTGIRVGNGTAEESIPVAGVFIYLPGNSPVLDFVGDELDRTENGCIRVRPDRSTSLPGVFAAGDVLCSYLQQVVVAAADGAIAALAAEKHVRGRSRARSDWGSSH